MKFFDWFKKKKKQEKEEIKVTQAPIVNNVHEDNFVKNIRVDGDYLKRVQEDNIKDGIFMVPEIVKGIDSFVFSHIKNLKTIVFHDGFRYIAPMAFQNSENLIEVKGLDTNKIMKSIGGFEECKKLESIQIPKNVQTILDAAFRDCKSLKNIDLPNGCWAIGNHSFAGCENLEYIEIPSSIELVGNSAFAGCKNLTVVFMEDFEKRYFEDYIKEEKDFWENNGDLDEQFYDSEEIDNAPEWEDEELEVLYDDMGIKHKKIEIAGKQFMWIPGRVIIKDDALLGVKEVIAYNQDTISKVIKSGYQGKITLVDKETEQAITIDMTSMKKAQAEKKEIDREKYYSDFLIPPEGTINWLINCERGKYKGGGYSGEVVRAIQISDDCCIKVKNYTQPADNNRYNNDRLEFFTCLTFYKKELISKNGEKPEVYERGYNVYYPYGAKFDFDILKQVGEALSILIDNARGLSIDQINKSQLEKIYNRQKQLIELLLTGTKDVNAVSKIMEGITLNSTQNIIREAKFKKDYLPYYTGELFSEFKEYEEYKKSKKKIK